jgi:hypothetical protein
MGSFLDRLTLPALVDFTYFDGPWAQPQLISLLKRSECWLQKLHFRTSTLYVTENDLEAILQLTQSFAVLNLSGASPVMMAEILDRLTHRELSTPRRLLPKLQTLRLCHYSEFITDAFTDMIESRWRLSDSYDEADIPQDRIVRLERRFLDLFGGVAYIQQSVRDCGISGQKNYVSGR